MKTILITGASSGFGKATAKLLMEEGNKLILIARREIDKNEYVNSDGHQYIHTAQIDVRDKIQVKSLFETLPEGFKNIDVVINNAGLAKGLATAQESDLENWDEMIDTNIKGLAYVTRYALENMKKLNSGLIINIGSVASTVPYKGANIYGATKAFVKQFSRNLRTDLFGTNIKVTNIEPGMAETEFSLVRFDGDKDKAQKVYEGMRVLAVSDIAKTIKWVIDQPENVNIDNIEIMPIDQTFGGMAINRV